MIHSKKTSFAIALSSAFAIYSGTVHGCNSRRIIRPESLQQTIGNDQSESDDTHGDQRLIGFPPCECCINHVLIGRTDACCIAITLRVGQVAGA